MNDVELALDSEGKCKGHGRRILPPGKCHLPAAMRVRFRTVLTVDVLARNGVYE
jgi:hypothetical protein